ncbi:MAG: serine hydrolase domain-containing protein [Halioglobus sp.]
MKKAVLLSWIFAYSGIAISEDASYSIEEVTSFRNEWTLENWDSGGPLSRYIFLNMPEFWNHSIISRSGPMNELSSNLRVDVTEFITTTDAGNIPLGDYVASSTVNGAIVLHHGKIVFEAYPQMRSEDSHVYMSVSKVFASTLIAILEDRGLIDVSKGVGNYLPSLKGTAWSSVAIRDVLDMASGINCLEQTDGAYSNPEHCFYQHDAAMGFREVTGKMIDNPFEHIATLRSHRPAGEAFEYTSVNTFLLGWLAETISGRPYADLISTEIWKIIGAESDGIIAAPRKGVPIASAGISSTLRDMARFGLLFTPSGRKSSKPLISDAYLAKIQQGGRPEIFNVVGVTSKRLVDGEMPRHNSYQWDFVMNDGDFFKGGFAGQGLYISPSRDLVIAFFGMFDEDQVSHQMQRIARQLAKSNLFN